MTRGPRPHRHRPVSETYDAVAEYWQLANDPTNGLDPDLRVLVAEVARELGCELTHRTTTRQQGA